MIRFTTKLERKYLQAMGVRFPWLVWIAKKRIDAVILHTAIQHRDHESDEEISARALARAVSLRDKWSIAINWQLWLAALLLALLILSTRAHAQLGPGGQGVLVQSNGAGAQWSRILNFRNNITLSCAAGVCTVDGAAGGPGGSTAWGSITGTLSSQTDLQAALTGKSNTGHTHLVGDITNFPTTWDWAAIANKPSTFTPSAHTHLKADITDFPTLATVATSGAYADLSGKPTIPAAQVQTDWNAITGMGQLLNKPTLATVATSGVYTDLTSKPTLGTAAAKDVPAAGDASATQVVYGTDSRLTNSRAPTAHASTHVTGGGDVIANVAAAGNSGLMTGTDKTKLDGIASGATVGADWNTNVANKPTLGSLAAKSSVDYSTADVISKPTLGTSAAKNIPATGNAAATEVVYGTDSRLADARTPVAHNQLKATITDLPCFAPTLAAVAGTVVTGYNSSTCAWSTAADQTSTGGGTGTVTNTGGNLTANAVVLGAGTVDTKVSADLTFDPTAKQLNIGQATIVTQAPLTMAGTVDGYLQAHIQNKSAGASASSDFVATADTGTDTTKYCDFGINSSAYSAVAFNMGAALDGYLYCLDGNLDIAAGTAGKELHFHTGGTTSAALRAKITDTGLTVTGSGSGALGLTGSTSGTLTQTVGATVTDYTLTWPNANGTGYVLNTAGTITYAATATPTAHALTSASHSDIDTSATAAADLLIRNAGNTQWAHVQMSSDCTITAAGAISCTKSGGIADTVTIAKGTSTLTTTAIASGACATTVTSTATSTATTDRIAWSYASFASPSTDGRLVLNNWPTSGNVNWSRCNPTSASITPTALVINWMVLR